VHTKLELATSGLRLNKTKKLALSWDAVKGRGVTAQEDIVAGEFVCEYKYSRSYPQRERKVVEATYATNREGCYVLEVVAGGRKMCLDATDNLNSWGRYVNHLPRKKANLRVHPPLLVRDKWRVAMMASRDIKKGEELGYDYGQERDLVDWMRRTKVIIMI
jgi:hypothetical protein